MTLSRKEFLKKSIAATSAIALTSSLAIGKNAYPQQKIKVGIIGCGNASNFYLPHLNTSPYAEVVSLCDLIIEKAQQQAMKYRIKNYYPNIEKMLEGEPFDLLVNLTDIQEHGRINRQGLIFGKHIWSEKPLASTYREGQELLELARSKELRMWSAPVVANSPQFAFMSKTIQDGKLGRISAAHGHYGNLGPDWASFFYEKGGGSLADLGVYNLTTITGLLGPAKAVIALTSTTTPNRKIQNKRIINVEADDNAMVILDHGDGVLSHIQCGYNYFDPSGFSGKGQQKPTLAIWGTKGSMSLIGYDWAPSAIDLLTGANEKVQRLSTHVGSFVWQQGASMVAETLTTGKEPYNSIEHALHVIEIIEAAKESATIGKRFNLRSGFRWPVI